MYIFVNNPGNLSNADTLARIMIGIDKFEHAEYAIGPSSTQLWLNDYMFYTKLQVEIRWKNKLSGSRID